MNFLITKDIRHRYKVAFIHVFAHYNFNLIWSPNISNTDFETMLHFAGIILYHILPNQHPLANSETAVTMSDA